jgi:hypothetical protein
MKRNRYESSQTSPTDAAQALEWIMVDQQGVNVRASMHNIRDDGWDPSWLRERTSIDGVMVTRRASRAAEEAVVAAASQEPGNSSEMKTLSQLSQIDAETFAALDQQTRYEWSKARADAEKKRLNYQRAEQSAVFQLLKARGSGKVAKVHSKNAFRSVITLANQNTSKQTSFQNTSTGASNGHKTAPKKFGAQMPITAYASPIKDEVTRTSVRCFRGEPIMASTTVHTATLLHALDRVLAVDSENSVEGRLDVAAEVIQLHIEELARDGRRQEVRGVRSGLENIHSDHPRWLEVRASVLLATEPLIA